MILWSFREIIEEAADERADDAPQCHNVPPLGSKPLVVAYYELGNGLRGASKFRDLPSRLLDLLAVYRHLSI
jgi:hypothetical protein